MAKNRFDVLEALDGFSDGAEVGHRPTEPAMVHIEHTATLGFLADGILGLAFGADEEHVAATGGEVADELGCIFEMMQSLLQIDDVNAVPFAEDEWFHLRVPSTRLVPEVNSGFEQLLHLNIRHGYLPYLLENWKRLRALGCPYFFRSTLRASRVKKPTAFSRGRNSALNSSRAREMPCRIAPA